MVREHQDCLKVLRNFRFGELYELLVLSKSKEQLEHLIDGYSKVQVAHLTKPLAGAP
jgi:hypothetical protein